MAENLVLTCPRCGRSSPRTEGTTDEFWCPVCGTETPAFRCKALRREDAPADQPDVWGWALKTVHPDDPACVGEGFEDAYTPRKPDER